MLKEITTFVAQKSVAWGFGPAPGRWIIGTNLFAGHVPVKNFLGIDIPVRYLAVLENAGGAVLADVGGVVTATPPSAVADTTYWPKYAEKAVQLLNQAKSYFVAHLDAEELYEALHQTAGWKLPLIAPANRQYLVTVIDAYGPPAPIENPGERGLFTFSCNYTWKIEEASC